MEIHAEFDRAALQNELETLRGQIAFAQKREEIKALIAEVVDSEFIWIEYAFSEGRELVGMNVKRLAAWTLYCAKDVYQTQDIETDRYDFLKSNPLKFMEK